MIYREHEDEGSAILERSTEQNKPTITASYSLANNSYQTQIVPNDTSIKETISNNIVPPSNSTNNDRQSERIGEALLTSLGVNQLLNTLLGDHRNLGATKANCLSTFLLGATLVISVLNTLLLSFVVKSIQLNDKGFISGNINWDNHLDSTIFDLPTKVAGGKSISLESIKSYTDDKPLNLDISGRYTFTNLKQHQYVPSRVPFSGNQNKLSESFGGVESTFLSTAVLSESQKAIDEVALSKFNYLSIHSNYHNLNNDDDNKFAYVEKPETLRIRTNLMVLNQIIEKQASSTNLSKKSSSSTLSSPYQLTAMPSYIDYDDDDDDGYSSEQKLGKSSKATDENIKQLLILNGERKSVTLPLESQLNLASSTSGSITLDEQLRSSEITGSLKEDLNIQTRDGNLACKSKDSLRLMSRSAGIQIATFEELTLKAPSLNLKSANNLYIQNGLEYFDSTQLLERDNLSNGNSYGNKVDSVYGKYKHDKDDERINNILTQSADVERDYHQSHGFSANGNGGNNYDLRAYNLVVADGILIAVA